MAHDQSVIALGFMSGTSLDGIDAALIRTDGVGVQAFGPSLSVPYSDTFRHKLKTAVESAAASDSECEDSALVHELTELHIELGRNLKDELTEEQKAWADIDVVGFHGHTVLHRPERRLTQQIGSPKMLANALRVPVIGHLRQNDVASGGHGAPLAPVYHSALYADANKPVCIVNIGGIANLTWIGDDDANIVAFDTGPGNGLLDTWMERSVGQRYDEGGKVALQGKVDRPALEALTANTYFSAPYPKSLDRSDLSLDPVLPLSTEDGAATLAAFTVETVLAGIRMCPAPPSAIFVTGGGRHNRAIMRGLSEQGPCLVRGIEQSGYNGDVIEAQAFAFMAVRSQRGLPISFPGTTGAPRPLTGGALFLPD
jgi:anhydro-N-acetylmuramic acid kinase